MSFPMYAGIALGVCFGTAVVFTACAIYEGEFEGDFFLPTAVISAIAGVLWPLTVTCAAVFACAYPIAQYAKRRKAP